MSKKLRELCAFNRTKNMSNHKRNLLYVEQRLLNQPTPIAAIVIDNEIETYVIGRAATSYRQHKSDHNWFLSIRDTNIAVKIIRKLFTDKFPDRFQKNTKQLKNKYPR